MFVFPVFMLFLKKQDDCDLNFKKPIPWCFSPYVLEGVTLPLMLSKTFSRSLWTLLDNCNITYFVIFEARHCGSDVASFSFVEKKSTKMWLQTARFVVIEITTSPKKDKLKLQNLQNTLWNLLLFKCIKYSDIRLWQKFRFRTWGSIGVFELSSKLLQSVFWLLCGDSRAKPLPSANSF